MSKTVATSGWEQKPLIEGKSYIYMMNAETQGDATGGWIGFQFLWTTWQELLPNHMFYRILGVALHAEVANLNTDGNLFLGGEFSQWFKEWASGYTAIINVPMRPSQNNAGAGTPIDRMMLEKPLILGRPNTTTVPFVHLRITPNQNAVDYRANLILEASPWPYRLSHT